jgi:hypothetical protein
MSRGSTVSIVTGYRLAFQPARVKAAGAWGWLLTSTYPILSAALGPGVYSASNKNEY